MLKTLFMLLLFCPFVFRLAWKKNLALGREAVPNYKGDESRTWWINVQYRSMSDRVSYTDPKYFSLEKYWSALIFIEKHWYQCLKFDHTLISIAHWSDMSCESGKTVNICPQASVTGHEILVTGGDHLISIDYQISEFDPSIHWKPLRIKTRRLIVNWQPLIFILSLFCHISVIMIIEVPYVIVCDSW